MKVSVDSDSCTGCGLCSEDCPEVFELKEDTCYVKVTEVPEEFEETVRDIAANCPVEAIKIEE